MGGTLCYFPSSCCNLTGLICACVGPVIAIVSSCMLLPCFVQKLLYTYLYSSTHSGYTLFFSLYFLHNDSDILREKV